MSLVDTETGEHFVYRCYDDDGNLLYVGCTGNIQRRRREHLRLRSWADTVAWWEVERYPDRRSALAAERVQIEIGAPLHNVDGQHLRSLFVAEDYGTTIERYVDQSGSLLATAQRLADECIERYGVRFEVPAHASQGALA